MFKRQNLATLLIGLSSVSLDNVTIKNTNRRITMEDKNELNIDQLDNISGGYIYYNE